MARSKVLWCVTAMMVSAATMAWAEDKETGDNKEAEDKDKVAVGVTADFFSKYIWRGQNIIDNWVLQPGASVGYKGLTGSVWGNMDLTGEAVNGGQLNEIDFTLDYSNKLPGLDVLGYSVGVIHYDFVNTHFAATSEAYAGLTAEVPLSPGVRWFYDFEQFHGNYVQFSIGHTIEKLHAWQENCYCGLQAGASLGLADSRYNEGYFGVDKTALNDLTLTAGVPFCLGKLTIRPSIGYSILLDQDLRDATAKSDNFWGGVGLAYNF
jgi:hypothetical protein